MATIFVTGSTTGLGSLAGERLRSAGHRVILHARDQDRAAALRRQLPNAPFVVGDLSSLTETFDVVAQVNELGPIDAVIHNAGIYGGPINLTHEGIPATFAVNVLAPYVLTAKIPNVPRLVYLSSGMHQVRPVATDPLWRKRAWSGTLAYSESKFYVTALAMAVARLRPDIFANAVDPGWVPTRMGGSGAPDDLYAGAATQVALASGADAVAALSGEYLHHMTVRDPAAGTSNPEVQERLLKLCLELSAVAL
jgi:NAD(P)-dependent dehydrogenase (short-subunit alcohol dehydrogenase family)